MFDAEGKIIPPELTCHDRECRVRQKSQPQVVWITWEDASYQSSELFLDDLIPGVTLETIGLLIAESETHYSVALQWHRETNLYRYVSHIPKAMVTHIRRIEATRFEND